MADSLSWQIGQWEPVSPDCDAQLVFTGANKTFDCNARWDGVSVPFQVTNRRQRRPDLQPPGHPAQGADRGGGGPPVLGQRCIEDAFAPPSAGNSLTCDSSIAKEVVVELNAPTPYRCVVAGVIYYVQISPDPSSPYSDEYQVTFTNTSPGLP
jgi:hypothetical protein